MNNANLYASANGLQRRDAEDVIKEFLHLVKWSKDGNDDILDVGCGEGDVMTNVLLKHLPENYGKLVGVDVSEKMIKYAKSTYSIPSVNFSVMDICCEINNKDHEAYNHIFSFNCLQWVQDQRTALSNIYSMLKPGGDCILSFGAKNHIYDVYKRLAELPKWARYMKDYMKYIPPYHFSPDPLAKFKNVLNEAGFKNAHVEYRQKTYYFYGMKNLRDSMFAVNPFLDNISSDLHDDYFDDYMDAVRDLNLMEEDNNNNGDKVTVRAPYYFIVCYAKK